MRYAILLAVSLLILVGGVACQPRNTATGRQSEVTGRVVKVFYIHRDVRCPSCETIETLSKRALDEGFSEEMAAGRLTWLSLSIDNAADAHFESDYTITEQSVVVAEFVGDRQTRWKKLDKVWDLFVDEPAFLAYVTKEVKDYLAERGMES